MQIDIFIVVHSKRVWKSDSSLSAFYLAGKFTSYCYYFEATLFIFSVPCNHGVTFWFRHFLKSAIFYQADLLLTTLRCQVQWALNDNLLRLWSKVLFTGLWKRIMRHCARRWRCHWCNCKKVFHGIDIYGAGSLC